MNDARIRYPRPHHGRSIQLAHSWGRAHRFRRTKAPGLPPCTGRNRALWIIPRHRKRTRHGSSAYRGPMNAVSCAGMALADKKDQMDGLYHIRLADGISRIVDGAKGGCLCCSAMPHHKNSPQRFPFALWAVRYDLIKALQYPSNSPCPIQQYACSP